MQLEPTQLKSFAKRYLKTGSYIDAVEEILPAGTPLAKRAELAELMQNHKSVKTIIAQMVEEGSADELLATELEVGQEYWKILQGTGDLKLKKEVLDSFCSLRGFKKKPDTQINVQNNTVNNKVMVLEAHGDDDDWEKQVEAQQQGLLDNARSV